MSHLDHVVRVKERMSALGMTCPFEQRKLIDQAYIDAIVMHHFACNPTFTVNEKERDCYRCMIDKWNNVSPIGYEAIYSGVISCVNLAYSALRSKGRLCMQPHVFSTPEGVVDMGTMPEYNDLVGYLYQEVKNKHE